jgi:hypothetical protein
MVDRIKSVGLIAALLVVFLPAFVTAQDISFSVSPAVVEIDDLSPGQAAEFQVTINNNDDVAHVFIFTASQPAEEEMRERRAGLPDENWVSFCPVEIAIPAGAQTNVTVKLAIPPEKTWAGRDWETWLGVAAKSSDLLGVQLYVRLLVSTGGIRLRPGLIAGIAAAVALLGYGGYRYARHRAKLKCQNPNDNSNPNA